MELDWHGKLYSFDADRLGYSDRQVDREWLEASGFRQFAVDE